uniref:Protein kinase domain-containing protein n=1 Tax=Mola mola TaxID=94237 RepID=A0A3Q4BVQ9_MOLML
MLAGHPRPGPFTPTHRDRSSGPTSGLQKKTTFDLPSDSSDVTLEDIERCYDIGRAVGDGNFAVVRECRRRDNVQTLAVKIVERSKLIGREHMMQNELSLLGSLCHPRIVRLFAHHHTHTHSYLVMELVGGGDLFDAISEKGRFSESEAGLMVSDVSEALNYIHCKSIVHRDVKPENLLEEQKPGTVIGCESFFVVALLLKSASFRDSLFFTICGTPTYVAPEILCETGYGVAVDVWALGVILYILLCGFPPFRSKERDQEELFQLIKQGHFHFLSPYWDPISEEARGLVTALLQPDPTMRLTAEQTWLHPWVTAMASICRQRALTDRAERSTLTLANDRCQLTVSLTGSARSRQVHLRSLCRQPSPCLHWKRETWALRPPLAPPRPAWGSGPWGQRWKLLPGSQPCRTRSGSGVKGPSLTQTSHPRRG